MFDVLDSCLVCGQMLCNKCLLQGFHASCIAYPALDYKEAVPSSLIEHGTDECGSDKLVVTADDEYEHDAMSSRSAFYPVTCGKGGKKTAKPTTTYKELDNSASWACRKGGVTKRGTASNRGRGSGGGGGGGGDDRRPYYKSLPEDANEQWTEDELARIFERILERAGSRFLSHMPLLLPPCTDESAKTANKNKWMNWMKTLLDGRLALNCGSN